MAHGVTEERNRNCQLRGTESGKIMVQGKDVRMSTMVMSRKGVVERSLKVDEKEEEVDDILAVMMSLIRNGRHLVGLADMVLIQMMKAIAERKQNWTNQNKRGETGLKERNMDPHILMILKKMTLVVLTVALRLSPTVVVITLTLKLRRVKIEIGRVGEDFAQVLVLLNLQMLLGHWERVMYQLIGKSKHSKLR